MTKNSDQKDTALPALQAQASDAGSEGPLEGSRGEEADPSPEPPEGAAL